jgi:DNA-directed RNA polymerase specialized sigma24 family protein
MPNQVETPDPEEAAVHAALARDAAEGWRAFIERYTDTLLALIERAGIQERDEAMDVYTRVCDHLAEDGCARLRRHDPAKGALGAWLSVVVRNVAIDRVRSRTGRRRLFKAVRALAPFDHRVFALHFWGGRRPAEVAEVLRIETQREVGLADVLEALERIHAVLERRQRAELLSLASGLRSPMSLHDEEGRLAVDPVATSATPEQSALADERNAAFAAALATLPAEDAAIVRLRFVQGCSLAKIRRALHLASLGEERLAAILARVRSALEGQALAAGTGADLTFLSVERAGPREPA